MIGAYIHNIYLVTTLFCVFFILLKKIAYITYTTDKKRFIFGQTWYYWLEMCYILLWVNLTPVHTYNEAIGAILLCMIIKAMSGLFTFLDPMLIRWLK